MTQVFKDDGSVVPVTLIQIVDSPIEQDIKGKEAVVIGTSKGKGFAGVMKRWGFKHQHVTRGSSNKIRTGGSIGCQTPGHVFKGKKMAGHLGNVRVTIQGLKVIDYIKDDSIIMISGSVPGARNSSVVVRVKDK
ncbi:MAG TPA: 50S ribosomal protein L3 [candidate division WWE3 bacterium]|uniref:Large ribosomal subunit protein uL3 n=1 Tax=candidate division WWE3 bacterium TaxID=2053526 RepID=A0A7C1HCP4_UNCKA|nr:50S ribosomal protein L3 [candidate division WWE3 bacterium]